MLVKDQGVPRVAFLQAVDYRTEVYLRSKRDLFHSIDGPMIEIEPAYRINTPRLVLRCWDPADAPLLSTAISESLDHLRPWMPWAQEEPQPIDVRVNRLRRLRGDFDLGRDFVYGIFDPNEAVVLGGSGLHTRIGHGALEIGYWVHADHIGKGYATEVCAALTRVAFEVHQVRRVVLHCDPDNARSAAIPGRLGYSHEATLRQHGLSVDGDPTDTMLWVLVQDEYLVTPVAAAEIQAFDALGRQLI